MNIDQIIATINNADLSTIADWDRRKTILDVFYDGKNADYVNDEDDFHRQYAGLIEVARWAIAEAREIIQEEFEHTLRYTPAPEGRAHIPLPATREPETDRDNGAHRRTWVSPPSITIPGNAFWDPFDGGDAA